MKIQCGKCWKQFDSHALFEGHVCQLQLPSEEEESKATTPKPADDDRKPSK